MERTQSAPRSARVGWNGTSAEERAGLVDRVKDAYYMLSASGNTKERVRATLDTVETMRRRVRLAFGVELRGLRMLDVGPGQQLRHMRCFSKHNRVVGIDTDPILQDLRVADCVDLMRRTSLARVARTVVKKAVGVDRQFELALAKRLGGTKSGRLDVRRMDATDMTFQSGAFDFIYAYSALEHIDRPLAALSEMRRVLAPGGVAYVSIRLYTSHSGHHDPKLLARTQSDAPYWPHLRPKFRASVTPSTYVNPLSLAEWKHLFDHVMPDAEIIHERQEDLVLPLRDIRATGELCDFGDDELLTLNFVALWRKPHAAQC